MRRPQSKRRLALELCRKLLDALDSGKITTSNALQLLFRIAKLINDDQLIKRIKHELDGFQLLGSSPEDFKRQLKQRAKKVESLNKADIDRIVTELWKGFPDYRILSFKLDMSLTYSSSFKKVYMSESLSKYEELLERIRKDRKTKYTYSVNDEVVVLSAPELNRLVQGVRRWVYEQACDIGERLEFGEIPAAALETTFEFVDSQLFELIPDAAERLIVAYQNLAARSEENWVNVVDTCRRIVKDFADAVFPSQPMPVENLVVTEDKYLNRIRAFVKQSLNSRRKKDQLLSVLELLAELLAKTDNLASRSVHSGKVSRFEAERILLYTYLAIGDIIVLTNLGKRPDATDTRPNLNQASIEDLHNNLGLTRSIATEIIKARKYRRFESWGDVEQVKGIGPKTLEKLKEIASL